MAKQLSFSKKATDSTIQFNYQWLDKAQEKQSISFVIEKTILFFCKEITRNG